jgi:hypothetical protein
MKFRSISFISFLTFLVWVSGCAILQRESPEKKARELMTAFQASLSQSDEKVLKFFDTEQSRESLLSAIDILQNNDSEFVRCTPDFNNMTIELVEMPEDLKKTSGIAGDIIRVMVPSEFIAQTGEGSVPQSANLIFMITERKGQYVIYNLEGGNFYSAFTSMKHDIQYASHVDAELKEREAIYEMARELEEKFDTLVWYAQYNGKVYFYAVQGEWNEAALYPQSNVPKPEYKMGLIDETGNEIIPIAFEMIGTLGMYTDDAVEVKSSYGYGYLTLSGDTLVSPEYQQIIPYPEADIWIVQNEGVYGFVDDRKQYTEGFLNANVKHYVEDFAYLPSQVTINESNYTLCESPRNESAGSGNFISPSFWVAAQLTEPIQFGLATTASDAPIGGWTEYIEFSTFFQSISDGFGVIVTNFKERYLEGREEFYQHNNLLFTDAGQNIVSTEEVSGESVEVTKISESTIQVTVTKSPAYYWEPGADGELFNSRSFLFYRAEESGISALESRRTHKETEFVKLDESYINGDFKVYSEASGQWESYTSLPTPELEYMRNEILAEYGSIFKDENVKNQFSDMPWYSPQYENESDFAEALSEIDKHNLAFLAKVLSERKVPEGDV